MYGMDTAKLYKPSELRLFALPVLLGVVNHIRIPRKLERVERQALHRQINRISLELRSPRHVFTRHTKDYTDICASKRS